jgi:2,4-dienoyl-CoA reductase-like NADH-dependent reductase (Old Yellow Enzyme family)
MTFGAHFETAISERFLPPFFASSCMAAVLRGQVPFAESIKRECGILTGAVGMITEPQQAEQIIKDGKADIILLARQMLRDPYWPLHAAQTLDYDMPWPPQYDRAK